MHCWSAELTTFSFLRVKSLITIDFCLPSPSFSTSSASAAAIITAVLLLLCRLHSLLPLRGILSWDRGMAIKAMLWICTPGVPMAGSTPTTYGVKDFYETVSSSEASQSNISIRPSRSWLWLHRMDNIPWWYWHCDSYNFNWHLMVGIFGTVRLGGHPLFSSRKRLSFLLYWYGKYLQNTIQYQPKFLMWSTAQAVWQILIEWFLRVLFFHKNQIY